ncbi:hypothetical protein HS088_TW09G00949 [Tripterygium wilfordii]|uniref:Uncharacterized protein n=1 Tax=Tripterygium wilfordii TaxID=458696 RepID=A0A7J7D963_TRIWF|nr:uncharacterized protein LOC120006479 [Tripterygium wilfordii]KAF5742887.1 hypothetical protein HS088_TW09G00949 [Tripterygium wilfordii]
MGEERFDLHNLEQEQEEAEEALSLRDLPLDDDNNNNFEFQNHFNGNHNPRSSSDLFEFFNDFSVDMCPAEEIIFCGKLLPRKDHYYHSIPKPIKQDRKRANFTRKRSESLSDIQGFTTPRSISTKARLMRNSRSLDYRKDKEMMERSSSSAKKAVPKPARWYYVFMMFGMAKIPMEMELTDIKNRQSRQNPPALLPPVIKNNNNSYKLIRVLSCKDHASVAVATTSFPC